MVCICLAKTPPATYYHGFPFWFTEKAQAMVYQFRYNLQTVVCLQAGKGKDHVSSQAHLHNASPWFGLASKPSQYQILNSTKRNITESKSHIELDSQIIYSDLNSSCDWISFPNSIKYNIDCCLKGKEKNTQQHHRKIQSPKVTQDIHSILYFTVNCPAWQSYKTYAHNTAQSPDVDITLSDFKTTTRSQTIFKN